MTPPARSAGDCRCTRSTRSWSKGTYADLDNAPEARKASSITAAEFLKAFVGDVPWVHMDIAGTAWGLGRPYVGKGASGFGVRTLIELAARTAGGADAG